MEYLWSPWRLDYVSNAAKDTGCVFCTALTKSEDAESLLLYRGTHNFIILNRYPYNNGHLMIAPYAHLANLADADKPAAEEMMLLTQRVIQTLREAYKPDGFNVGMNLGRIAGAGVDSHYHMHVVPRWNGDTNFMTALSETRVIPESFETTLSKLKPYFVSGS
jgi:ATP adenylyltransferase